MQERAKEGMLCISAIVNKLFQLNEHSQRYVLVKQNGYVEALRRDL